MIDARSKVNGVSTSARAHLSEIFPQDTLRINELVRRYDNNTVIGPISFSVAQGEFLSLLGPSGCGKTTLLRAIAGFEKLTAGSVMLDGVDISRLPAHRRGLGLIFQSYALFPHLSIFDNVAFGLRLRKTPKDELAAKASAVLEIAGLHGLEKRLPSQISGGQQQRVAIARSLVLEPKLLLLDEPLSNLDFKLRVQMRHELRQMQRKLGMTFVYVTHDQTEAMALSDRIVVLRGGRIEQQGPPEEIYNAPKSRFVADFIGTSNFLTGKIEQVKTDGTALVRITDYLVVRGTAMGAKSPGDSVCICIRPESLHPRDPDVGSDGSLSNAIWAKPISVVFSGERTEVIARLALQPNDYEGQSDTVTFYLNKRCPLADSVCLGFAVEDTIILNQTNKQA